MAGINPSRFTSSGSSTHVLIFFLIGTLLGCIQIQYQSSEEPPFDKYYGAIKSMIFPALCLYAAGYILESTLDASNSTLLPTVKTFTCLFGFLVVILLILLLLLWFGLFLLMLWTFLLLKAVMKSYHEVWTFFKGKIEEITREHLRREENESPVSDASGN